MNLVNSVNARSESFKFFSLFPLILCESGGISPKFIDIFSNAVINIDYAMNDIVIKCYSGMANAACAAFDSMNFDEVVGTLAGDDTIFAITRSEKDAAALVVRIKELL
jgi:transcriptional regulator of arginine metabolism